MISVYQSSAREVQRLLVLAKHPVSQSYLKRRTALMDGQDNRLLLERYLTGLLDPEQEYALRREDVVIDMPQSGERIRGRDHMKAMQEAYPGPPTITVRQIVGSGDVWETRYYADPFE